MAIDSLEDARVRLQRALDRLETAAARMADGGRVAGGEVGALRADRDRLGTALAEVQQKYADLRAVTEAVSARLESTIGKVSTILGG